MPTVNVTVPVKLKAAIEQRVASGEYAGIADYVCDLVRRDQQRQKRLRLEQLLLNRLNRAGAVEMDAADLKRIRRRLLRRLANVERA